MESKKKVLRGHVGLILEVFTWIRGPQSVHLDSEAREIINNCIQKKSWKRILDLFGGPGNNRSNPKKKEITEVAPRILDFFGGPGNKLKKEGFAPHCMTPHFPHN